MATERTEKIPRRATLRDVARMAGVAPITVSRALRTPDKLLPETRAKIEAAIAASDYVPDLAARGFRTNRTGIVAAIVPSIENAIYGEMLQGVSSVLDAYDVQLMVGASGLSLEQEERLLRAFLGRRPDAILLVGGDHTARSKQLLKRAHVPVVEAGPLLEAPIDLNVGFSEERAAAAMVDHLVAQGYHRIGFICGPVEGNERARRRLSGFKTAIEAHKREGTSHTTFTRGIDFSDGSDAFSRLMTARPDLDCVFCSSDVFAVGALLECSRHGWQVPNKIAVAGFHGMPLAMQFVPSITTVSTPQHEIGQEAGRLIMQRLAHQPLSMDRVDLGFRIVRGRSA